MYRAGYALHPASDSVLDLENNAAPWLYDRCTTYLTAHAHTGDVDFLRDSHKACSFYAGKIGLSGSYKGLFSLKSYPDIKYSHLRGLYVYYALTGSDAAYGAGLAMAEMWLSDPYLVAPYKAGHLPGPDKLWTERNLAAALEGLLYGHRLTGKVEYLNTLKQMITTAHAHVTGSAAVLAQINPGASFPPQNCFIHNGLQQAEEGASDPWCSPWMTALMVEPLSEYRAQTQDSRVDEIFIRLGRFLRDLGTSYFTKDLHNDSFLSPSVCDVASAGENRRRLVPLYGVGINASGQKQSFGEWSDFEHCSDTAALMAAATAALHRSGKAGANPVGPFANEGASFVAVHHELLSCAQRTFDQNHRAKRDPANWTSGELSAGSSSPSAFIDGNKIGYPSYHIAPPRKLSWWFNGAMLQFGLLAQENLSVAQLVTATIQPSGC
jgi:hypothetical protein